MVGKSTMRKKSSKKVVTDDMTPSDLPSSSRDTHDKSDDDDDEEMPIVKTKTNRKRKNVSKRMRIEDSDSDESTSDKENSDSEGSADDNDDSADVPFPTVKQIEEGQYKSMDALTEKVVYRIVRVKFFEQKYGNKTYIKSKLKLLDEGGKSYSVTGAETFTKNLIDEKYDKKKDKEFFYMTYLGKKKSTVNSGHSYNHAPIFSVKKVL